MPFAPASPVDPAVPLAPGGPVGSGTATDVDAAFVGTESLRLAGARSVIVLPLRANGHRIGTLILANTRPRNITAEDVEPLELLAALLAATLPVTAGHT